MEGAAKEKGWDPKNPNGFPAQKADVNNTNGVPGYTYTTNGELLGVEDKVARPVPSCSATCMLHLRLVS
jgi:hypothetical protein